MNIIQKQKTQPIDSDSSPRSPKKVKFHQRHSEVHRETKFGSDISDNTEEKRPEAFVYDPKIALAKIEQREDQLKQLIFEGTKIIDASIEWVRGTEVTRVLQQMLLPLNEKMDNTVSMMKKMKAKQVEFDASLTKMQKELAIIEGRHAEIELLKRSSADHQVSIDQLQYTLRQTAQETELELRRIESRGEDIARIQGVLMHSSDQSAKRMSDIRESLQDDYTRLKQLI